MNMRSFRPRLPQGLALARLAGLLILGTFIASAHETDNFCLPLDTELADLGHFLETLHTIALQETVAEVNARIEKAIRINDGAARAERLQRLHDPLALSKAFLERFGHPMFEDTQMERALRGAWAHRSYAGRKPSHQDLWMSFSAHKDGRPEDPAYFDNLARELSTYYGESYGHSGQVETLLTIGNTCIPAMRGPLALCRHPV